MDVQMLPNNSTILTSEGVSTPYLYTELPVLFVVPEFSFFSCYSTFPIPMLGSLVDRRFVPVLQCYITHLLGVHNIPPQFSTDESGFASTITEASLLAFVRLEESPTIPTGNNTFTCTVPSDFIVVSGDKLPNPVSIIKLRQYIAATTSTFNKFHDLILTKLHTFVNRIGTLRKAGWKPK